MIAASRIHVVIVDQPRGILRAIGTIPKFLWEFSLGVYLTVNNLSRLDPRGGFHPAEPR